MKGIIDKLDFIKIKKKNKLQFYERQCQEKTSLKWGEIFPKDISDKGLLSKVYKELLKLTHKETKQPSF